MPLDDRYNSRWSYERLLLSQPHVGTAGLWTLDGHWYAVVPRLAEGLRSADGKPLEEWFSQNKSLTSPVQLCTEAPPGAFRVPDRTASEIALGQGDPLTVLDVLDDLALMLPRTFPDFRLTSGPEGVAVRTAMPLSAVQEGAFRSSFEKLGTNLPLLEVRAGTQAEMRVELTPLARGHALDLIVSRRLSGAISKDLTELVEEDEDLWMQNREALFAGGQVELGTVFPRPLRESQSRCLVDASVFKPSNIRTFLPIYEHVLLIAPLLERQPEALAGLQISEEEMVALARDGRLLLLLPQSLDRYRVDTLARIAAEAPEALVLSRRLATLSVMESRRRLPFLHPGVSIRERGEFLSGLGALQGEEQIRSLAWGLAKALSSVWANAEQGFHRRGAMASYGWGAGAVMAAVVSAIRGRDYWFELNSAAAPVEWAAALRATLFPGELERYSSHGASELCASLYSGVPTQVDRAGDVELALQGLLSVNNDAPLGDVVEAFRGADVDRLRRLIANITDASPEEIAEGVRAFNESVRRFERRTERLKELDVAALAGVLGTALAPAEARLYVGLGAWTLKALVQGRFTLGHGNTAELLDKLRAVNSWTRADVVMVSRLRRALRS